MYDDEKEKHGGRGGSICALSTMWLLFYLLVWILFFPDWTHSAWQLEDNLMGRVKRFNGLFLRCISPKDGAHKCDNYGKPTFHLDGEFRFFCCWFGHITKFAMGRKEFDFFLTSEPGSQSKTATNESK